jgi:hypothetical protein
LKEQRFTEEKKFEVVMDILPPSRGGTRISVKNQARERARKKSNRVRSWQLTNDNE